MYVYKGKHRIADEPTPAAQQLTLDGRKVRLKPCGTDAAYQRHLRRRETPCDPCKDAHAIKRCNERGGNHTGQRRGPVQCGTYAGATGHRKRGEKTCFACCEAERIYHRDRRARKAAA